MEPPTLPADAGAHFNAAALPGFLVWAGVIIFLVAFAFYLKKKRRDD